MTRSFFERLTGSVRIGGDDANDAAETLSRPQKLKGIKQKADDDLVVEAAAVKSSRTEERSRRFSIPIQAEDRPNEPKRTEEAEEDLEGELTLDVYDEGAYFVVQSTVAGVRPEDLDISVTNDTLIVRGMRRRQQEIREDKYYVKELYWGRFSRSVILPEEVEADKVEALIKNGLLTIRLPKKDKGEKKIRIKVE